jgi:hypothetical protein
LGKNQRMDRWFSDDERRYGKELWKLANVYLPSGEMTEAYRYRKVWREGLEVAIKVKGSQGNLHVEWPSVRRSFSKSAAARIMGTD